MVCPWPARVSATAMDVVDLCRSRGLGSALRRSVRFKKASYSRERLLQHRGRPVVLSGGCRLRTSSFGRGTTTTTSSCLDGLNESIDALLDDLASAVFERQDSLGELARALLSPSKAATRQRDIFPLGLWDCSCKFTRAVIVVLNHLYGVKLPVSLPERPTASQRAALEHIESSARLFKERLREDSLADDVASDHWEHFEPDPSSSSLELVASLVDLPRVAGSCDPMPLLPPHVASILADSKLLFSSAHAGLARFPGFFAGRREEYVKLVVAQLRCSKLELRTHVLGGGTIFPVGKRGGRQREVWHGAAASKAACRPPRPEHLASPSAFKSFDLGPDELLRLSKRDGQCFFDQLILHPSLREYCGRPSVSVSELLDASTRESRAQ